MRKKKNAAVVVSFGIDTSGQDYLKKYLKNLQLLLPEKPDGSVVVYHYHTSPERRAGFFKG